MAEPKTVEEILTLVGVCCDGEPGAAIRTAREEVAADVLRYRVKNNVFDS